jgi:hypothetical protein
MKRVVGRDDIEYAMNTLAAIYAECKGILNKDDRQAMCHTHRVVEELAKSRKYRPTKEYGTVDIDVSEFTKGDVVSPVGEQDAYWGQSCANMIELEE